MCIFIYLNVGLSCIAVWMCARVYVYAYGVSLCISSDSTTCVLRIDALKTIQTKLNGIRGFTASARTHLDALVTQSTIYHPLLFSFFHIGQRHRLLLGSLIGLCETFSFQRFFFLILAINHTKVLIIYLFK